MKLYLPLSVALILLSYSSQGALAQENRGQVCPLINVSRVEPSVGSTVIYKANVQGGDSLVTPKFNWTVNVGKITSGQGTSEVSVEAEGNNTITVTVEVTGYASECPNKASNTMIVEHVGLARKFDEYHDLKFNEERLRLDQFAITLHNEPGAMGCIIVYDAKGARKPAARARGDRAKNYLVKERGLPEGRIVIVNGGSRDTRTAELFIVPFGAVLPTGTPK